MLFWRTFQFFFYWILFCMMLVPVGQLVGADDPFEWAVYASIFLIVGAAVLFGGSLLKFAYEAMITRERLGVLNHELTEEMLEAAKQNLEKKNGTTKDGNS